jgi:hypothetical protein
LAAGIAFRAAIFFVLGVVLVMVPVNTGGKALDSSENSPTRSIVQ